MNIYKANNKILYVDDEVNLLASLKSLLRKENYEIHLLEDSTKIESILNDKGPFAVILSDQRMPGLDGVSLLKKVADISPDTLRVLITGFSDHNETIQAVNLGGISKYINKPWNDEELKSLLKYLVKQYNLLAENTFLLHLNEIQKGRLSELLNGTIAEISKLLIDILAHINQEAAVQTETIRKKCLYILNFLTGITEEKIWEIKRASELLNIGYALMPAWIQVSLNKEGLSAAKRFSQCNNHHKLSANLLSSIPGFQNVAKILFDLDSAVKNELSLAESSIGVRILRVLADSETISTNNFYGNSLLKTFLRKPQIYDKEIVEILINYSDWVPEIVDPQKLSINELKPGMIVLQGIKTKANERLIPPNFKLTDSSITALQNWSSSTDIEQPVWVQSPFKDF